VQSGIATDHCTLWHTLSDFSPLPAGLSLDIGSIAGGTDFAA
jgi:hypothetical protein